MKTKNRPFRRKASKVSSQKSDRFAQQFELPRWATRRWLWSLLKRSCQGASTSCRRGGTLRRTRSSKLKTLAFDGPVIKTKAAPKAKTPSAAAAASTMVTLRGRTAAAAEPKETGNKRKSDPTEPRREAAKAVQNLSRRRLDSTERASQSLRQRASPSHTTCVLRCSCSSGQLRLVSCELVRGGRLGEAREAVEEPSLGGDGRHRLRRHGRTDGDGPRWEVLRRLRRHCD